jgi:hypothetical protein
MKTIERVMRVMTHVNIGCALGMVAWVAWSGIQVVAGHSAQPQFRPSSIAAPAHQHRLTTLPPCCIAADPHETHHHAHDGAPVRTAPYPGTRI